MRKSIELIFSGCLCLCSIAFHTAIRAQTDLEVDDSLRERAESLTSQLPVKLSAASEQIISYDDVYGIELTLPFTGDIEIRVSEGSRIVVKLEKHGVGINEEIAQTYLDTVKMQISRLEDILQLTPKLPENFESDARLTRINCLIEAPPDISVKIHAVNGNVRVGGLRGVMNIKTNTGNVQFNETMGQYQIALTDGRIYGRIFLTKGKNAFETLKGSIDLVILDSVSAPMDFTAINGGIRLRLPEHFPAEVEIKNEESDQRKVYIELPAQIDHSLTGDVLSGAINGGGPLIRLNASDQVAILAADALLSESTDTEVNNQSSHEQSIDENDTVTVPTAAVSRADVAPIIDGNLFEKSWSNTVALHYFYQADGILPAQNPTQVFLMWDEKYLYIGVRAYDSRMSQVRVSQRSKDSAVWDDDSIEVLIDPNPQTHRYYHLICNPIGTVFDQIVQADYPPGARLSSTSGGAKLTELTLSNGVVDLGWDAHANIKTQITSTFWCVEIALPLASLEAAASDQWRFNVLRKVHRQDECSYWSPTYDIHTPWWPHWREQMGILNLVSPQSSQFTDEHVLEEKLEIAGIEVHGNSEISTPEIIQLLPFTRGDVVTVSELSWLKAELEIHDWFRQVHLETAEALSDVDETPFEPSLNSEPLVFKVVVSLRVTEMPTRHFQMISLHNNRFITSNTLRAFFGLKSGRTSIEELAMKCQLITTLYRNSGYQLASTRYQFFGDGLKIHINEGRLHEVRFVGNRRVKTAKLMDSFTFNKGEIFNSTRCQSLIDELEARLKSNKSHIVEVKQWQLKLDGEKNVLEIEVEERSVVNWGLLPILNFNRVHGVVLGGSGDVQAQDYGGGLLFGELSYGLSSAALHYQLGAEKKWFDRNTVSVGGGIHKLTDTNNNSLLSSEEELLAALVLGDAFMDYYLRHGYQAWIKARLTPAASISLNFTDEKHEILFTATDWSLFNRNAPKKSNLRINEGHLRSVTFSYDFDSRNHRTHTKRHFHVYPTPNSQTTRGWQGNFSVEYAGKRFQTDFDFTLYRFKLARYNRLNNNHFLDVRMVGGISDAPLPRQRLFYLGGLGTLRGYGFKELVGDNMLLFNMEYRLRLARANPFSAAATAFIDSGYAWHNAERPQINRFNTSIGVGLSLDSMMSNDAVQIDTVRIEIARALRKSRNVNFILRLARMF